MNRFVERGGHARPGCLAGRTHGAAVETQVFEIQAFHRGMSAACGLFHTLGAFQYGSKREACGCDTRAVRSGWPRRLSASLGSQASLI